MAAVDLKNVTKIFGSKRDRVVAVGGANLSIRDREMMVLLGPSGCGKTTTLRLVAGLERLTDGTIEIDGRSVNSVSPKDRDVALVFQNYVLYPHLSVYDNLAFGLRMRGTSKLEIASRVQEVAIMLGVENLLKRRPHQLSGGQQQRVALGRAIVRRPRVYLLDEPLANLDAQLRVRMRVELKRRQRELGMTMLYVTHDQHEAMAIADRIAVMQDGRVQQIGRPQHVYRRPVNRFVAGFVGSAPMNFIDGVVAGKSGDVWFEFSGCVVPLRAELVRLAVDMIGRPVVLGVRPQSVRVVRDSGASRVGFPGVVTMIESLGDGSDVHVRTQVGDELMARVSDSWDEVGEVNVRISFDPGGVFLFERGSHGANIVFDGQEVGAHAA